MDAMAHGSPRPKKTLTAFEPVIFPTAASAFGELLAALILANVSGSDVPRATSVIADTDSSMLRTHPKTVANSPTMNVMIPIYVNATKKAGPPPHILGGGIVAKMTCHPIVMNYIKAS